MTELFIKHLNTLSSIEPDNEFRTMARALILNTPRIAEVSKQHISVFQLFRAPRFVFSFAALVIAVGFVGFSDFQRIIPSSIAISGLDAKNIATEFEGLSIDVKLAQVSYGSGIEETVALAVSEISTRQVQQTVPILSTENGTLPSDILERNEKIDSLLEDVLF